MLKQAGKNVPAIHSISVSYNTVPQYHNIYAIKPNPNWITQVRFKPSSSLLLDWSHAVADCNFRKYLASLQCNLIHLIFFLLERYLILFNDTSSSAYIAFRRMSIWVVNHKNVREGLVAYFKVIFWNIWRRKKQNHIMWLRITCLDVDIRTRYRQQGFDLPC